MTEPTIKDSGAREGYAGGMVRDTEDDKIDWTNLYFGPMARRWAVHTTKGRAKYNDPEPGIPNWSLGLDLAVWLRARRSFLRHEKAWLAGQKDEDHAAGMFFNVNLKEYIEERLSAKDLLAARKIERLHAEALGLEGDIVAAPNCSPETRTSVPATPWGECGKTCSGRRCFDTGCQGDNPNYAPPGTGFQLQTPEQIEDLPHEAGDTGDRPWETPDSVRQLLERARSTGLDGNGDDAKPSFRVHGENTTPSRGAVMRRELVERDALGDPDE